MAAKSTTTPSKAQKPVAKMPVSAMKAPKEAAPADSKASRMKAAAAMSVKTPVAKGAKLAATSIAAGAVTPTIQRNEGDTQAAPMTPKNFRNHPDMENFFRFIYENDLRLEALQIIDEIIVNRAARRKKGPSAAASANA